LTELAPVLTRLFELVPRGSRLDLVNVKKAAESLEDVHRLGQYVHVAGTNGKGSVSAMLANMALAAGEKVGLYTSPHLCRFGERIQINGQPLSDAALARSLTRAMEAGSDLTFFEVTTLAALLAFREAGVTLTVLEVGLGGRLDATNIVEGSAVTIITRVAFDHMDRLGNSLSAIAQEKAGILRAGAPCIVGRLHPDARAVVDAEAHRLGVPVYEATAVEDAQFVELHPPALAGGYQRQNAMIATAAARALGIAEPAMAEGLQTAFWPGRFEVLETSEGYIILDGAHNPDGALALRNSLGGLASTFQRKQIALVFGSMGDKNWRAMLDRLAPVAGPRVYVAPPGGRAPAPPETLAAYLAGDAVGSITEALSVARQRVGRGGVVVVCGSLFLVGAVRGYLLGLQCDPPVAM
jgi:dihydrofolate synthase / folylpolyglutamate synthase